MNEHQKIEEFLKSHFSSEASGIATPSPKLIEAARLKVQERNKELGEFGDLFTFIAGFLNMKIKLYHAVIACIVIGACILLSKGKEGNSSKNEAQSGNYVSNIAAVKNSTVLSSINTFVTYK